ncbi:MAG: hypothetical protein WA431_09980 [Candidatus Cybelea sp.]
MRSFAQSTLTINLAATLLVGCGGSQPMIGAPGTLKQASALAVRTTVMVVAATHAQGWST